MVASTHTFGSLIINRYMLTQNHGWSENFGPAQFFQYFCQHYLAGNQKIKQTLINNYTGLSHAKHHHTAGIPGNGACIVTSNNTLVSLIMAVGCSELIIASSRISTYLIFRTSTLVFPSGKTIFTLISALIKYRYYPLAFPAGYTEH